MGQTLRERIVDFKQHGFDIEVDLDGKPIKISLADSALESFDDIEGLWIVTGGDDVGVHRFINLSKARTIKFITNSSDDKHEKPEIISDFDPLDD